MLRLILYACSPYSLKQSVTVNLAYFYFLIGAICFPILLIFTSYCNIFFFVKRSKRRLMKFSSPQQPTIKSTDVRLLKSILIILLTFILLWTPFITATMYSTVQAPWSYASFREGYVMCAQPDLRALKAETIVSA